MGALDDLIANVADRIRVEPRLALVDVHEKHFTQNEDEEIFEDRIAASLAASGVVIGVMQTEQNLTVFDAGGPLVEPLLKVVIWYDPFFSKSSSRQSKQTVCESVSAALHLFVPDGQGATINPRSQNWRDTDEEGVVRCEANFDTTAGLDYDFPVLGDPIVSVVAGTATISGIATGAACFYTTANEYPSPRNGELYSGPFAVPSGTKIKARVWLAGYKGSKVVVVTA